MQNFYGKTLETLEKKKLIFWGTDVISQRFYQKNCVRKLLLSKPIYWCDNNKEKQNQTLFDIPIISPDILKSLNPDEFSIVITTGEISMCQILAQLCRMKHKEQIETFDIFYGKSIEAYAYFTENEKKYKEVISFFADEESSYIYENVINNLKNGQIISLALFNKHQYLGNDVIDNLDDCKVFIDAGVCKGEEIDKILKMNMSTIIHAFEPDYRSMKFLMEKYKKEERVILHELALWDRDERLTFLNNENNKESSGLVSDFGCNTGIIQAIALDNIVDNKVDFIKMDIEGAEYKALLGAEKTIKRYNPKLAISVYHSVEDYVEIPLLIKQMNPKYKLYFRQHSLMFEESVIYAL